MWPPSVAKSLEEYSSTELDDLLKLMGVRQHILMRGHVDGYRLVRLTNAQLMGFPFTAMERWKLQMIRTAHMVFKVFTRGLNSGGSCPINAICSTLKTPLQYDDDTIQEVKQGLLSHTVTMRNPAGDRVVTFDQWAQLFDWIGSRLDLHNPDKLHARMGCHVPTSSLDTCRDPLQVMDRREVDALCMPLELEDPDCQHGHSVSLMTELFREVLEPPNSPTLASDLQEEASLNPPTSFTFSARVGRQEPTANLFTDHVFSGMPGSSAQVWPGLRGGADAGPSSAALPPLDASAPAERSLRDAASPLSATAESWALMGSGLRNGAERANTEGRGMLPSPLPPQPGAVAMHYSQLRALSAALSYQSSPRNPVDGMMFPPSPPRRRRSPIPTSPPPPASPPAGSLLQFQFLGSPESSLSSATLSPASPALTPAPAMRSRSRTIHASERSNGRSSRSPARRSGAGGAMPRSSPLRSAADERAAATLIPFPLPQPRAVANHASGLRSSRAGPRSNTVQPLLTNTPSASRRAWPHAYVHVVVSRGSHPTVVHREPGDDDQPAVATADAAL